jgi:hypothetical protein
MTERLDAAMFPVDDLARAMAVYAPQGVQPSTEEPYHVGIDADGHHVGVDPSGHTGGMTGPLRHWYVDDIMSNLKALLDTGAGPVRDITDVGGGRLIATRRWQRRRVPSAGRTRTDGRS